MLTSIPPTAKLGRPWGNFCQYTHNLLFTIKVITVAPGGILSRQYHHERDELDGEPPHPEVGDRHFIQRETVHRLSSVGEGEARVPETSFGEFDEDDVARLDDVYGRA